jgi:hypothetical protein
LAFVRYRAEITLDAMLAEHKTATVTAQNESAPTLGVALARADEVTGAGDNGVDTGLPSMSRMMSQPSGRSRTVRIDPHNGDAPRLGGRFMTTKPARLIRRRVTC